MLAGPATFTRNMERAVSPAWQEAASALRAGTVRGGHFFTPSHEQHP